MELITSGDGLIGSEELAIVGLMESIFNLADNCGTFVHKLENLRSKSTGANVSRGLSPLRPAEEKVRWLVGFIRHNVIKEAICSADAERRQSVSTIIDICTFQVKYLTSRIFVGSQSSISQSSAFLSIFGKKREIQRRVNFLSIQANDLTQLLNYLNKIRPSPSKPIAHPNPPISMVPRIACNDFIGREPILTNLVALLLRKRQVALVGSDGIGKTEVCLQFARKIRDKYPHKWIFWIDGKDRVRSIDNIARYLRLDTSNNEPVSVVAHWLKSSDSEWFLIVDDVNITHLMDLSGYDIFMAEPQLKSDHIQTRNILISSAGFKASMKGKHSSHTINIPPLHPNEAAILLKQLLPMEETKKYIEELIQKIGCSPHVLKTIARHIKDTGLPLCQYLTNYDQLSKEQRLLTVEDAKEVHTVQESKDDVQTAAAKIAKTFLDYAPFEQLLKELQIQFSKARVVAVLELQLQEYAKQLKGIKNESRNTLPDFIIENYKRISSLLVDDAPDIGTYPSFPSSWSIDMGRSFSRRPSFSPKMLHPHSRTQSISFSMSEQQTSPGMSTETLNDEVLQSIKKESKRLQSFYFNKQAFDHFLIRVVQTLGSITKAEVISSLSGIVANAWDSTVGQVANTIYAVKWELPTVLDSTFQPGQELSEVIAISGMADNAEAVTCRQYIQHHWPNGKTFQNNFEIILSGAVEDCEATQRLHNPYRLTISVKGPPDVQADIARTIAWLAAAVRHSDIPKLTESQASVDFSLTRNVPHCSIECCNLTPVNKYREERVCWHRLFVYTTVAIGYPPIHERKNIDGKGLEIPYDLMVNLAKAKIITESGHGYILQGYQFALVPVKFLQLGDSGVGAIQWHLVDSTEDSLPKSPSSHNRIPMKAKSLDDVSGYASRRTFLGWCDKIKIRIATDAYAQNPENPVAPGDSSAKMYADPRTVIMKSNAKSAGRALTIANISTTLGGSGHGATGSLGVSLAFGDRRSAAVLAVAAKFEDELKATAGKNVILYDTDSRRAWMLPYISVLLHLVHLKERSTKYLVENCAVQLPFAPQFDQASESYKASHAALEAINPHLEFLKNSNFDNRQPRHLDRAEAMEEVKVKTAARLIEHLEYILTVMREVTKLSVAFRSKEMAFFHERKIYGFEFKDLAWEKELEFKEQKLSHSSGGWAKLRRDKEVVLFCRGLGDAILPVLRQEDDLCEHCKTLPKNLDWLAAPISCLSTSQHAQNCGLPENTNQDGYFRIKIGNRRNQWDVREHQFSHCVIPNGDQTSQGDCNRTTRISRKWWFSRGKSSVLYDFSQFMDGAVIFGQPSRTKKIFRSVRITKWKPWAMRDIASKDSISPCVQGNLPNGNGTTDDLIHRHLDSLPLANAPALLPVNLPAKLPSNSASESSTSLSSGPIEARVPQTPKSASAPTIPGVPIQPDGRDPTFLSARLQSDNLESVGTSSLGRSGTIIQGQTLRTSNGESPNTSPKSSDSRSETRVEANPKDGYPQIRQKGDLSGVGQWADSSVEGVK